MTEVYGKLAPLLQVGEELVKEVTQKLSQKSPPKSGDEEAVVESSKDDEKGETEAMFSIGSPRDRKESVILHKTADL